MFQALRDKKLREWIQCLYNIVIDPVFAAINQSMNDRKEQILRVNTSQLALPWDPITN